MSLCSLWFSISAFIFVLCDFPFQHSSLFSCFFSDFPLLLTFECISPFVCLCSLLFDFMPSSFLAYFVHLCGHVCVFVTEGFPNPFPIGTECSYQNKHCRAVITPGHPVRWMIQDLWWTEGGRPIMDWRPKVKNKWFETWNLKTDMEKPVFQDRWNPQAWGHQSPDSCDVKRWLLLDRTPDWVGRKVQFLS